MGSVTVTAALAAAAGVLVFAGICGTALLVLAVLLKVWPTMAENEGDTRRMNSMEALTGRSKPLVRIWDRDFNLVYSGDGDIGEVIGQLTITVDAVDGTPRSGGRITSVSVAPFTAIDR